MTVRIEVTRYALDASTGEIVTSRRPPIKVTVMAHLDIESTKAQARKLLDSRIESVTNLVKTKQRVTELQDSLKEAERENSRAYVKALRDGWSEDELKKLGLENTAAGKRRTRRTVSTETVAES